jgi:hypothetical protein
VASASFVSSSDILGKHGLGLGLQLGGLVQRNPDADRAGVQHAGDRGRDFTAEKDREDHHRSRHPEGAGEPGKQLKGVIFHVL